jgi:kumamolisin
LIALIALLNQGLGRDIGYFNPRLYREIGPAGILRNITGGNNGGGDVKGYPCGPGWNACTGWGSPDGKKLLEALRRTQ